MLLYKTTLHQCDRFTYIFHLIRSEVYNAVNVPCRIKKKHWALTSPSKQTPMQILFVSGQCDLDCSNPNFLSFITCIDQAKVACLLGGDHIYKDENFSPI